MIYMYYGVETENVYFDKNSKEDRCILPLHVT